MDACLGDEAAHAGVAVLVLLAQELHQQQQQLTAQRLIAVQPRRVAELGLSCGDQGYGVCGVWGEATQPYRVRDGVATGRIRAWVGFGVRVRVNFRVRVRVSCRFRVMVGVRVTFSVVRVSFRASVSFRVRVKDRARASFRFRFRVRIRVSFRGRVRIIFRVKVCNCGKGLVLAHRQGLGLVLRVRVELRIRPILDLGLQS